jgi:hypothetical protein
MVTVSRSEPLALQANRVGLAHLSKLPQADDHHRSEIDVVREGEGGGPSWRRLRLRGDPDRKARWIVLVARMLGGAVAVVAAGTVAFFVATYILNQL